VIGVTLVFIIYFFHSRCVLPNRRKSVGRWVSALSGALVMGLIGGKGLAAEWPLVLPTEVFAEIPDAQGMSFFIDTWVQVASRAAGGPMTVTKSTLQYRESEPEPSYYKVIHTTSNYVLLVSIDALSSVGQWTWFRIFTTQKHGEVDRYSTLRMFYCVDPKFKRPEPFEWPKEKLLQAFKSSRCFPSGEQPRIGSGWGDGWNSNIFQRIELRESR
jgi:hypothetical protein